MQVNARIIGAIVFLGVATTATILANIFATMMIGEINRKRQDRPLLSYFNFTIPKILEMFSEYRLLYPSGKLHIVTSAAVAVGFLGIIGFGICFGIIG